MLAGVARRLTNAEIATSLGVSERTVESHVSSLLRKLDAANRLELGRWAPQVTTATSAPVRLPAQLEALRQRGPFVGRRAELDRLLAGWATIATGTAVAVLHGEAGIGKSRLAATFAGEVHDRGGRVVLGTCSAGTQAPYAPFAQIIAQDASGMSDAELRRRVEHHRQAVARLVPAVAARLDVDEPPQDDPVHARNAVLAAIAGYLRASARRQPLLVVVEDLHWASRGTLDALDHVARAGGEGPLMVLATTRDERPFGPTPGLRASLGGLAHLSTVEMVEVSGLTVDDAEHLIDELGSQLDPASGVAQTGGNPLFLGALARGGPTGGTLGALVAGHFARLPDDDLDVIDTAAVIGEQIEVGLVAAALGSPVSDVLDALERAETAGVVGAGTRHGRFAFTHDVFRSAREASLTASRRFRLHAAVAEALQRRPLDPTTLSDLATHACLAGPRFDPSVAADLARRAGDAATVATDHGPAVAHYRRALDALSLVGASDNGRWLDVRVKLGSALVRVGDDDGVTTLVDVAEEAERAGDPVALAAAVCSMAGIPGGGLGTDGPAARFMQLAESALRLLPTSEPGWRIQVQATLGVHQYYEGIEGGEELLRAAVDDARRLGDPVTLGRALMSYRHCGGPLDSEQRIACGHELIELGERTGMEVLTSVGLQQLWWCHRQMGDREEMDAWTAAAAARVRGPDCEQRSHEVSVAMLDGDLERTERLLVHLADAARPVGYLATYVDPMREAIDDIRGRPVPADVLEHVLLTMPDHPFRDALAAFWARVLVRSGQPEPAAELLRSAGRRGFGPAYVGRAWTTEVCYWAEVAALVGVEEAAGAAHQLTTILEPLAGRWADNGLYVSDTIDRARALVELARGDPLRAGCVAAEAASASRRRRTPILLARELVVLAAAQQRAGDDQLVWQPAIDEALVLARRAGARIVEQDVGLLVGGSVAPLPDPHGLTPRERDVLERVRAGDTNAVVASALDISPATVRKHLEHAYRKLNVSTRTAAVARAADRTDQGDGKP